MFKLIERRNKFGHVSATSLHLAKQRKRSYLDQLLRQGPAKDLSR